MKLTNKARCPELPGSASLGGQAMLTSQGHHLAAGPHCHFFFLTPAPTPCMRDAQLAQAHSPASSPSSLHLLAAQRPSLTYGTAAQPTCCEPY